MAEKFSLKTFIIISFLCGILSACMSPIDIQVFMEDPEVKQIIDATKVSVVVHDNTGDGLVGRNGKIDGLKNNKYYMVEKEEDKDGNPVNLTDYPKYVSDYTGPGAQIGPGGLSPDLEYITRIKGGSINGLQNFNEYTVSAAQKFSNTTEFTYSVGGAIDPSQLTVNDKGEITIFASEGADIALESLSSTCDGYYVMAVAVSPTTLKNTSPFYNNHKSPLISGSAQSFKL
jgi:hypothetical protein